MALTLRVVVGCLVLACGFVSMVMSAPSSYPAFLRENFDDDMMPYQEDDDHLSHYVKRVWGRGTSSMNALNELRPFMQKFAKVGKRTWGRGAASLDALAQNGDVLRSLHAIGKRMSGRGVQSMNSLKRLSKAMQRIHDVGKRSVESV